MITHIKNGIKIYRDEGVLALLSRAHSYTQRALVYRLIPLKESYELSINGVTTEFSALDSTVVKRNRRRFRSELQEISAIISELEPDDTFYDIGANTGLYSLFAAQKCVNGEVVAFEPYQPNVSLLKRDIARNDLKNIDVVDIPLSDKEGTIEFDQPVSKDVGFGSASIQSDMSTTATEIPTRTGDSLVRSGRIPRPNVVKIDVEGAEPLVIEGLEEMLGAPECRSLYCEVHLPGSNARPSIRDFGTTVKELEGKLEDIGFTVESMYSRDSEVFFKAQK